MDNMTLSMLSGIILSIGFSYIPGVHEKFMALDGVRKRLVLLAIMAVVTLAQFVYRSDFSLPAAWRAIGYFALETMANQATYAIVPQPQQPSTEPPQ